MAFISRLKYSLSVIISVFVVFSSGKELAKVANFNDYQVLNQLCDSLVAFNQPISTLIQDQDTLQFAAYCRSKGANILHDSDIVIEFCNPKENCFDIDKKFCTSKNENISRLYKQVASFSQLRIYRSSIINYHAGYVERKVSDFTLTAELGEPRLLPNNPVPYWMEKEINFNRYL
jgi:hypothetical protein